ncbi:MAG TPA: peptidoglycan DD-metalloendopeptidase family protein [Solirubrobacterales bacterium]|nr:peptidoglycan DD-metalloendopeptidase family protein [Solirubrobacterales bacterium]
MALLSAGSGTAAAAVATGGAATPGATPTAKGSPTGAADPAPSSGAVTLLSAQASPRKSYFFGYRYPRFSFSVASSQAQNDLQVNVVNEAGEVVRSFFRNDVAPAVPVSVRWDGTTAEGRPARNGRYSFQVVAQGSTAAARRATASSAVAAAFTFYGYAFPILGAHDFGSSGGRFGAGRAGHTHQGQDVMADCGTPLVAARGGIVQYSRYEANAGNYVVIDGKGTANDFMYAHLAEPSPLLEGDIVRTGQPIGIVGDTGDATACHLHFEIWGAPGWYEGGSPFDPLPYLEKWDAYS